MKTKTVEFAYPSSPAAQGFPQGCWCVELVDDAGTHYVGRHVELKDALANAARRPYPWAFSFTRMNGAHIFPQLPETHRRHVPTAPGCGWQFGTIGPVCQHTPPHVREAGERWVWFIRVDGTAFVTDLLSIEPLPL